MAAIFALSSVVYALGHNDRVHPPPVSPSAARAATAAPAATSPADDKDEVATIALGDPADGILSIKVWTPKH